MQTEVFEAVRAIDVPEDKALRAAAALASAFAKSEDDTARSFAKRDGAIDRLTAEVASLRAEIAALNNRLTAEIAAVTAKVIELDGDVGLLEWMVGVVLAMLVTLLFRSFTH